MCATSLQDIINFGQSATNTDTSSQGSSSGSGNHSSAIYF
jgi:hypothetical protein